MTLFLSYYQRHGAGEVGVHATGDPSTLGAFRAPRSHAASSSSVSAHCSSSSRASLSKTELGNLAASDTNVSSFVKSSRSSSTLIGENIIEEGAGEWGG